MQNRVLIVPEEREVSGPVIFLAGPIQGAPDWQEGAIQIILSLHPSVSIATPRRVDLPGEFVYEKQVDWETKYLRRAGENGVILFWLAKEQSHVPGRAYAQTTRFELAEWKVRHERDGVRLVIGIEEGFSNARYIRRRFSQDCPDVPFCSTLREACERAIKLL